MSYVKDLFWAMKKSRVPSVDGKYEEPSIDALLVEGLLGAVKFELPVNGQLFEDDEYKGLDKDEPLYSSPDTS